MACRSDQHGNKACGSGGRAGPNTAVLLCCCALVRAPSTGPCSTHAAHTQASYRARAHAQRARPRPPSSGQKRSTLRPTARMPSWCSTCPTCPGGSGGSGGRASSSPPPPPAVGSCGSDQPPGGGGRPAAPSWPSTTGSTGRSGGGPAAGAPNAAAMLCSAHGVAGGQGRFAWLAARNRRRRSGQPAARIPARQASRPSVQLQRWTHRHELRWVGGRHLSRRFGLR